MYTCGVWAFGQIIDRYATDAYGPRVNTIEAIQAAASTGRLSGLDLNYPWSDPDITTEDVQATLTEHDLAVRCLTPAIYTQRFVRGSFTNPDPAVRAAAADLSHEAVDVATTLSADYVKFWPGQDGYDYPFQVDYAELRQLSLRGIGDVARAHPGVQFGIEYKPKEPRTRIFWSTAAATLLATDEMNVSNVGIVIDMGHSLYAKENPAEVLSLIHAHGRLVDIELCDNYREWDDDLTVGALHIVETLEFLHMVDRIGWDAPLKLDLFPYREDPVEAVRLSLDVIDTLRDRARRLPVEDLAAIHAANDALAAQRLIQRALFA